MYHHSLGRDSLLGPKVNKTDTGHDVTAGEHSLPYTMGKVHCVYKHDVMPRSDVYVRGHAPRPECWYTITTLHYVPSYNSSSVSLLKLRLHYILIF